MIFHSQLKIFLFIKIFIKLLNTVLSDETNFKTFTFEENKILFGREADSVFHSALPSSVHELMTPDEILDTFSTNGSVPEYHIFHMKFSKGRKKRHITDEINISMEVKGKIINLNLKPTDGLLANRNTPFWQAYTDSRAFKNIRYDSFPYAMRDIGEFKMYQDLKNEAAIVIYRDHNYRAILEGVVTSKYIVKTLPERFSKISIKDNYNYFVDSPTREERSTDDDDDKIIGSYVLVKVEPSSENARYQSQLKLIRRRKRQTPLRSRKKITKNIIYPEIMLVIDHNALRKQNLTQALRFLLAFWNAVDMIYSSLKEPTIRLNIAGIIISADDTATPYIATNTSIKVKDHDAKIITKMGRYFYQESDRFPITYDIIIGMTTMQLCSGESDPCTKVLGVANGDGPCVSSDTTKALKRFTTVGIFTYTSMFNGVEVAAHETAHLIGLKHDNDSNNCQGFLMSQAATELEFPFKWSQCSKLSLTRLVSDNRLLCMENRPAERKAVSRISIGSLLTLDGQCRNFGFQKACQLPNESPCEIQGCQTVDSDECIQSDFAPLLGSKCNNNKHCDISSKCIND